MFFSCKQISGGLHWFSALSWFDIFCAKMSRGFITTLKKMCQTIACSFTYSDYILVRIRDFWSQKKSVGHYVKNCTVQIEM